jgi:hypothetical protein
MSKQVTVPRNKNVVSTYHYSYDPEPPHLNESTSRIRHNASSDARNDLMREDAEKGLIGSASISDLAQQELDKGNFSFSGLRSDDWKSDTGNKYRDQNGVILGANLDKGVHGKDVIFTARGERSSWFEDRMYKHRYRVPKSSIGPEVFGDDDIGMSSAIRGASPTAHVPLRRSEVLQAGVVRQMQNNFETNPLTNLVFAKDHMKKLGIQFAGTRVDRNYDPNSDYWRPDRRLRIPKRKV